MRLATQEDIPAINKLLNRHWDLVADDYSKKDKFQLDPKNIYFFEQNNLVIIAPITNVLADCHIVAENDAMTYAYRIFDFLDTQTSICKLMAHIPTYNRRCRSFVDKVGFKYLGVNTKSFMKNGELINQFVYVRSI